MIVAYIVGIVALGCWAGWRRKSTEGSGYFLADKSLTWPMIGLALFSTNISTIHLVSLAQAGYETGLAMGNFEWMAVFTLMCLSLFFAPFYLRAKVATLPDFLEKRYCRPCRDWFAVISILSAIFIHLGFSLYTGAVVLEGFLLNNVVDDPEQYRLYTIIVIAGITGLYTIIGGLMAVVLTESVQTIVLADRLDLHHGDRLPHRRRLGIASGDDRRDRRRVAGDGPQGRQPPVRDPPARRRLGLALVLGSAGLPGAGTLVLVRRPDDRPAGARGEGREPRPGRAAVRRFHQDPAGVHLRAARHDLPGADPPGQAAAAAAGRRQTRHERRVGRPDHRAAAGGAQGRDGRGAAWRR